MLCTALARALMHVGIISALGCTKMPPHLPLVLLLRTVLEAGLLWDANVTYNTKLTNQ